MSEQRKRNVMNCRNRSKIFRFDLRSTRTAFSQARQVLSFSVMSHPKTAGGPIGGRLMKSAVTSVLTVSSLAGGLLLSGEEAKATVSCFTFIGNNPTPDNTSGYTCSESGWTNSSASDPFWTYNDSAGGLQPGDVLLEGAVGGDPLKSNVRVNFLDTTFADSSGEYKYKITYNGSEPIIRIGLDVDEGTSVGHAYDVYKFVYSDSTFTTLVGDLFIDETSVDDTLDVSGTEFWIKDTWTTASPGIIQISNSYEAAPGPLPILGAGAAFGFSRKLRSRIKSAHSA
jgi:hypothetical protein